MRSPNNEHSVPWFWPIAVAIEFEEKGLELFEENMRFIGQAARIEAPPEPDWATGNHVILELDTMRLRDFSTAADGPVQTPVLIDAPYAGHSSTIADYAKGQSLVETFKTNGLSRVFVTDWMSATAEMRDYDIDKYLTDIDTAVKALGGRAHFVGLRQGGWMSAMYVCLFPDKLASLVLAGAPLDTGGGTGRSSVWPTRCPWPAKKRWLHWATVGCSASTCWQSGRTCTQENSISKSS